MKYRPLGTTGLSISEIGFGTGGNAGLMVTGSFEEHLRTVARALELGINYFDESPDYGDGVSETNLGRVLRELKAEPIITTKVEVRAENLDGIAGHVERSVEASMSRLGVDHVDVVQIHNGPVARKPELKGRQYNILHIDDFLRPGGALDGLERVQRAGKTRYVGFVCRGDDDEQVRQLIDTGRFQLINVVYTLLNPTAALDKPEGMETAPDFGQVIPYAAAHGVGSAIYSPLAAGILADQIIDGRAPHPLSMLRGAGSPGRLKAIEQARSLRFLSRECGSLAKAAMRFVLSEPGVTTMLGGFSDIEQLEEAVAASETGPLPATQLEAIAAVWRTNFARQST